MDKSVSRKCRKKKTRSQKLAIGSAGPGIRQMIAANRDVNNKDGGNEGGGAHDEEK